MSTVYLSCGSNLGMRRSNIEAALMRLEQQGQSQVVRLSSYYETEPVDYLEQPDFLNNVVELTTELEPEQLLALIRTIETEVNGGSKVIPKGPRLIDLDLLLWDDRTILSADLQVPHPAMCARRFVLVPLLEIAPELECPTHGRPFSACLTALDKTNQRVELTHG
ncbi:MAG: 2-amino-4-hydroxy-6-hydroxymethyldihydropteridine diphosphokinase [bacterium]